MYGIPKLGWNLLVCFLIEEKPAKTEEEVVQPVWGWNRLNSLSLELEEEVNIVTIYP